MIRILVDTNVYISALVFGGRPAAALKFLETVGLELTTSLEIQAEFSETLQEKFGWGEDRIREAADRLWRRAQVVSPVEMSGTVRDVSDDHILGAAVASGSAVIITGDRDLLVLDGYQGIRILTPAAFLDVAPDLVRADRSP